MKNTCIKKLELFNIHGSSFKETNELRIEYLERHKMFDQDINEDPKSITLEEDKIDYLESKLISKIKSLIANTIARAYFERLIKKKKLIIKEVSGIENYSSVKDRGIIITANHFHPYDNYAILKAIEKEMLHKRLYKVIREGNYTNFKGLYGYFFKHCNTLPLSSSLKTMKKFLVSFKELLERGETILIYPEQSMWYNYKKPKPFKNGAFELALKNNAPIVPIFISLSDSDILGDDGYYIQEYSLHILKPIFKDDKLSYKENLEMMKNANYLAFKETYEKIYKIPLTYLDEI